MLVHGQILEQNWLLRTKADQGSHSIQVRLQVVIENIYHAGRWRKYATNHENRRALSSTVVSQNTSDLILVQI